MLYLVVRGPPDPLASDIIELVMVKGAWTCVKLRSVLYEMYVFPPCAPTPAASPLGIDIRVKYDVPNKKRTQVNDKIRLNN